MKILIVLLISIIFTLCYFLNESLYNSKAISSKLEDSNQAIIYHEKNQDRLNSELKILELEVSDLNLKLNTQKRIVSELKSEKISLEHTINNLENILQSTLNENEIIEHKNILLKNELLNKLIP